MIDGGFRLFGIGAVITASVIGSILVVIFNLSWLRPGRGLKWKRRSDPFGPDLDLDEPIFAITCGLIIVLIVLLVGLVGFGTAKLLI